MLRGPATVNSDPARPRRVKQSDVDNCGKQLSKRVTSACTRCTSNLFCNGSHRRAETEGGGASSCPF